MIHETAMFEKILSEDQDHPNVVPPFNAYSAQGDPEVSVYKRIEML